MPKDEYYRPRIKPGSSRNLALLKACDIALKQHSDEFSPEERNEIQEFKYAIGGKFLVAGRVDDLLSQLSQHAYQTPPEFEHEVELRRNLLSHNWQSEVDYPEIEDLQHRLWEAEDNYNRGRLPHDQLQLLKQEIERREVRQREQTPVRIRPPESPLPIETLTSDSPIEGDNPQQPEDHDKSDDELH